VAHVVSPLEALPSGEEEPLLFVPETQEGKAYIPHRRSATSKHPPVSPPPPVSTGSQTHGQARSIADEWHTSRHEPPPHLSYASHPVHDVFPSQPPEGIVPLEATFPAPDGRAPCPEDDVFDQPPVALQTGSSHPPDVPDSSHESHLLTQLKETQLALNLAELQRAKALKKTERAEEDLSERERELIAAKADSSTLRAQFADSATRLAAARRELDGLRTQYSALETRAAVGTDELAAAVVRVDRLEVQLSLAREERNHSRDQLLAAPSKNRFAAAIARADRMQSQLAVARRELVQARRRHWQTQAASQDAVRAAQDKEARARQARLAAEDEVRRLRQCVKEHEKRAHRVDADRRVRESDLCAAEARAVQSEKELETMRRLLSDVEARAAVGAVELSLALASCTELEAGLDQVAEEANALRRENADLQSRPSELERQLVAAAERHTELQAQMDALGATNEDLVERLSQAEREKEGLLQDRAHRERKLSDCQDQLACFWTRQTRLETCMVESTDEINALRQAKSQLEARIATSADIERQLGAVHAENVDLQGQLVMLQQKNQDLATRLSLVEQEKQNSIRDAERKMGACQARLARLLQETIDVVAKAGQDPEDDFEPPSIQERRH
jgi:chromosome segregation ATPase